jgi:hypothetical protein
MNELILLQIGQVLILSWLITRFKPVEMMLELLPDNLFFNLVQLLLSCLMCVSFWTGLILTQDIYLSALISFIGFWYDKVLGFYERRVRLN